MPAYLSAIPHFAGRDINPYHLHQKMWEAFPGKDGSVPFLFTIQEVDGYVYVRSQVEPTWLQQGIRVKPERTLYPNKSLLFLEVLMNPVSRSSRGESSLRTKDRSIPFAIRLLERHGVKVLVDDFTQEPQISMENLSGKPVEKDGKVAPVLLARCMATVEVTDASLFEEALQKGIGRNKYAGAGMILVRTVLATFNDSPRSLALQDR